MFHDIEQVMDYIYEYLDLHKGEVGIKYVGYGDEELLPGMPALIVTGEPDTREVEGTNQFKRIFFLSVFIYHADLSINHRVRTQQDMQLATEVKRLLHADYTL